MAEFDLHAGIRKLAEADMPCSCPCHSSPVSADSDEESFHTEHKCKPCNGTGRIMPFAALRVKCHHSVYSHTHTTIRCPGWRPEPDIEKACWRLQKGLESEDGRLIYDEHGWHLIIAKQGPFSIAPPLASDEEAIICAALVWLEKQHD